VYERAVDVDHRSPSLWLKYAEMEMRNRFANHARNVWDRAVSLLPRVDQLWYKYTYMEEMLENYAVARTVWERWMQWEPDEKAWSGYVRFEERRGETRRARVIFERFVACHPRVSTYLKYAKWEERRGQVVLARAIFERAVSELAEWEMGEEASKLYLAFASFEERRRELERARAIYAYAAEKFADSAKEAQLEFEKKHGDRAAVEARLVEKRAAEYEAIVERRPTDYDAWLDLARLREDLGASSDDVRETYERAVAAVPPIAEKRYWRRYVYVWISYAVYEELAAKDALRARAVYAAALRLVPHATFTFAKLWLFAAELEVRLRNLGGARKLLGEAIGRCPKPKLFEGYLRLERRLGEVDRCRRVYAKFVEFAPALAKAWIGFADFEATVGELDRARALYDLALDRDLDLPELAWKSAIDLELKVERGDFDDRADEARARELYERLLERTTHVNVWTSYAKYLAASDSADPRSSAALARAVFERGYEHFKDEGDNDQRLALLEAWADLEASFRDAFDNAANLDAVRAKMPRKVKKRRQLRPDGPWEEYLDLVFPDDQKAPLNLKILEMARKWKNSTASAQPASDKRDLPEGDDPGPRDDDRRKRPKLGDD